MSGYCVWLVSGGLLFVWLLSVFWLVSGGLFSLWLTSRVPRSAALCKRTRSGDDYIGSVSVTWQGKRCDNWRLVRGPVDGLPLGDKRLSYNHCRNPDRDPKGPWCYVDAIAKLRQYCDIPDCSQSPLISLSLCVCGVRYISVNFWF